MRDYTNYRPSILRRFLTVLLRIVVWFLLDLDMVGLENIPPTGPIILVSNHISFLDPVLVVGLLPRPVVAMSKVENMEHRVMGVLARIFDAFPVRRGEADRQALETSLHVLEAGLPLWLSPEGTRSESGQLQRGMNGLAFIATRSGAPLVPLAFTGTDRFKHNVRQLKRTPVKLVVGKPFYIGQEHSRARGKALGAITDHAMQQIAALLPPEMRGIYT
jgi:1-acyl-sn-glycerol-3-phosphate acyltransferase